MAPRLPYQQCVRAALRVLGCAEPVRISVANTYYRGPANSMETPEAPWGGRPRVRISFLREYPSRQAALTDASTLTTELASLAERLTPLLGENQGEGALGPWHYLEFTIGQAQSGYVRNLQAPAILEAALCFISPWQA